MSNVSTLLLYLVMILVVGYCTRKVQNASSKKELIIFSMVTILFPSIVAGMRYGIGTDYFPYIDIFDGNYKRIDDVEPIFKILVKTIQLFTDNYSVIFFVIMLLTVTFTFFGLYYFKNEVNMATGMTLFMTTYYFTAYNICRQSLSVAIVFYAMTYLFRDKGWKNSLIYILLVLLAGGIHYSSLPVLILVVFRYWPIYKKPKQVMLLLIAVFVVSVLLDKIMSLVAGVIPQLQFASSYFVKKDHMEFGLLGLLRNLVYVSLTIYVVFRYKIKDNHILLAIMIYLIGIILERTALLYDSDAVQRLSMSWMVIEIYLVSKLSIILKNKKDHIMSSLLYAYLFAGFYYDYFIAGYSEVVPYVSIFSIK